MLPGINSYNFMKIVVAVELEAKVACMQTKEWFIACKVVQAIDPQFGEIYAEGYAWGQNFAADTPIVLKNGIHLVVVSKVVDYTLDNIHILKATQF
jgi:hypothetical protein